MRDLSTLTDLIAIVCDGDRSLGRGWMTVDSMNKMGIEAEQEETDCSQQSA